MDASCKIQRSIHDVRLTYKYVSRILGTYHLADWGGYFCVLLLPIVYPRLKAVKYRLITAIRPSSVNIGIPSFSKISVSRAGDFYVIGGVLSAGGTRLAPTVTECRPQSLRRRTNRLPCR